MSTAAQPPSGGLAASTTEGDRQFAEAPRAVREGGRWSLVDVNGTVLASPNRADMETRLGEGTFFWVDLHEPEEEDIRLLAEVFRLHPLALEDSASFNQRPKIDTYDDFALLVVYGATHDEDDLVEVHCFTSERFLITVRHDSCPAFHKLQHRYMERGDTLHEETMLLYHVVDGLVDSFFPALADLDDRIDALESEIFDDPQVGQLHEVFAMKQRLVGLRKLVTPMRDMLAQLISGVVSIPGMSTEAERYFRDVYDHLIRLSDMIDSYRELLTGAMDVYLSTVANRRDQVMKQLTVIATVFLPITFITGYFGQNFGFMIGHISSAHAFVIGTLIQIATVIGILVFFKQRRWL
jgi:magnesium transporter